MPERGTPFDPPAFCNICRFELYHAVPHVCDLPVEGTVAWIDSSYEERWMQVRHTVRNYLGDATRPVYVELSAGGVFVLDRPEPLMLLARTLPTYEDFDNMVDLWHGTVFDNEHPRVEIWEFMGLTREEYSIFIEVEPGTGRHRYHPLHGRR